MTRLKDLHQEAPFGDMEGTQEAEEEEDFRMEEEDHQEEDNQEEATTTTTIMEDEDQTNWWETLQKYSEEYKRNVAVMPPRYDQERTKGKVELSVLNSQAQGGDKSRQTHPSLQRVLGLGTFIQGSLEGTCSG